MQRFNNFIDGEWIPGKGEYENRSPSDVSDLIGIYHTGNASDVDAAVAAAASAQQGWAATSPEERSDILNRTGNILLSQKNELGKLLAREEGKTLAEATGEVERAGRVFQFFAGEALRIFSEYGDSIRSGVDVRISREPLGVIGLITPWNFPIAIPAWKAAPALAFGNSVVMKPAGLTPASAWRMTAALSEAGLPNGVFNLVMGSGRDVGEALLSHPDIAAITFTGSAQVGRRVAIRCAETHKKVQLEMGGKNPMIVLDDADLDKAVRVCINGAFAATGQRCTASSRLIVTRGAHDEFVERLVSAMQNEKVGHALAPDTTIGPAASEEQLSSNLKYVDMAREEGAEVIGGERLERDTEGFFQAPALFLNARNDFRTSQEEIFGPCASVLKVDNFDEAVDLANATTFGLSSGICTTNLAYASAFQRRSEAGMVMVNLPTAGVDYNVPFGGRKGSSYGPREQGGYAKEFYTSVKTSYVQA
ncbi:MAG: aldehyde dehydrogenase family protein [Pseudomonadota bacterium]